MRATTSTKQRQPLVDESEAATGATVTTSTVKHDATAKIKVPEDEQRNENGNPADSIHVPEETEKLEENFADAAPIIDVEVVNDAEIDTADEDDDSHAAELTEEGKKMLNDCETKITKGLSTFVEVGIALSLILINKLFLPLFKTWEDYLERRWGFTRQRAFQYMQAAEGHQKLSNQIAGQRKLPESERAMRELMKAPSDKLLDILDKLGGEGELTAERIIKVREEVAPKKASKKAKKKPAIKIANAMKAAGVWASYLEACDVTSLNDDQRKQLIDLNNKAVEKFNDLKLAA